MNENNHRFEIEVDGGMNYETIPIVISNGDFVVSGSFLANNISELPKIIE